MLAEKQIETIRATTFRAKCLGWDGAWEKNVWSAWEKENLEPIGIKNIVWHNAPEDWTNDIEITLNDGTCEILSFDG